MNMKIFVYIRFESFAEELGKASIETEGTNDNNKRETGEKRERERKRERKRELKSPCLFLKSNESSVYVGISE